VEQLEKQLSNKNWKPMPIMLSGNTGLLPTFRKRNGVNPINILKNLFKNINIPLLLLQKMD